MGFSLLRRDQWWVFSPQGVHGEAARGGVAQLSPGKDIRTSAQGGLLHCHAAGTTNNLEVGVVQVPDGGHRLIGGTGQTTAGPRTFSVVLQAHFLQTPLQRVPRVCVEFPPTRTCNVVAEEDKTARYGSRGNPGLPSWGAARGGGWRLRWQRLRSDRGQGGAAMRFPSRLCRFERELVPDNDGEDAGTHPRH